MNKIIIGLIAGAGLSLVAASAIAGDGKGAKHFDRLDTNGDGEISAEEMNAPNQARHEHHENIMTEADTDGNGSLSREEATAYYQAKKAARNPDKNGDGKVDRDEFLAKADERFEKLDKNGDGVLTADERKKHRHRSRP
jgi:Ca2+-binding EF-hand superfamily protein